MMENHIINQEREIAARDEGAEDYEAWYITTDVHPSSIHITHCLYRH